MTSEPTPLHAGGGVPPSSAESLLQSTARGDEEAFGRLYDLLAPSAYGVIRRVLRDAMQAEEVTQEVLVEVWRTASRYDASRGSVTTWVLTIAHRRAVDRVRTEQASTDRERRAAFDDRRPTYDVVVEEVSERLEHEQVRRCLSSLSALQREAVTLAYYAGYTYREVAGLLDANLATVKTRMRDGLARLRDCLGIGVGAAE